MVERIFCENYESCPVWKLDTNRFQMTPQYLEKSKGKYTCSVLNNIQITCIKIKTLNLLEKLSNSGTEKPLK